MAIRKVGYRYRPELKHLMKALKYKAKGGDMSVYPKIQTGDIVEMLDLYGEGREPWKVFSGLNEISELHDVSDWQQKSRVKYIVTKLIKSGPKNYCRRAGAGSWDGQGSKAVMFEGREILQMGTLTYEFRGDPNDAADKPHYLMHEYHLSQHSLAQIGLASTDYVICRVIKDLSKRCHVKRGKKRTACSTVTINESLPRKKAKKSTGSSTITIANNVQANVIPQEEFVASCSSPWQNLEQCMAWDDVSDLLDDDCFGIGATCSSEKEAFLETPDCVQICDPGVVIEEENDLQNDREEDRESTMDEFVDMLYNSLDNDDGEEEELAQGQYSRLLFGNLEDLEQCYSSEFMEFVRESDIISGDLDNENGEEEEELAQGKCSGFLLENQEDLEQYYSSEFMEFVKENDIISGDLSW